MDLIADVPGPGDIARQHFEPTEKLRLSGSWELSRPRSGPPWWRLRFPADHNTVGSPESIIEFYCAYLAGVPAGVMSEDVSLVIEVICRYRTSSLVLTLPHELIALLATHRIVLDLALTYEPFDGPESSGVSRVSVDGVAFGNRNWPYDRVPGGTLSDPEVSALCAEAAIANPGRSGIVVQCMSLSGDPPITFSVPELQAIAASGQSLEFRIAIVDPPR